MSHKAVTKYLEKYAESILLPPTQESWSAGLVIPSCNEGHLLHACFRNIQTTASNSGGRILVVFVINGRIDATDEVQNSNDVCIGFLLSRGRELSRAKNLVLMATDEFDYIIGDFAGGDNRFPTDQGVGLARKIGSDILCKYIDDGKINSPWITHTDADALVPADYFSNKPFTNSLDKNSTVAVFPFVHAKVNAQNTNSYKSEILNEAIADYDKYLHYYVRGLKEAGSPYANHTVGSTMSFRFDSYAQVRGYPKREAGEDFYLLNKLSKLGAVENLSQMPITLQGRPSDRVPFGTGQANRKLYDMYNNGESFQVYHPSCFNILKAYLKHAQEYIETLDKEAFIESLSKVSTDILGNSESFIEGIEKNYLAELISASERAKDNKGRLKHFHTWFDAFKTLKFVHWVRDDFCGTVDIKDVD